MEHETRRSLCHEYEGTWIPELDSPLEKADTAYKRARALVDEE